jgi:ABC-type multidrug transport system fused ATPase/permease subunit
VALFRLVDIFAGSIKIDDVDISQISKHLLRKRLTLIPQDPVLFKGTIRSNIDPFNLNSDEQIWNAVKSSSLYEFVSDKEDKLEYIVEGGGLNMSVGERSLLCLARAFLRRPKVILLDESTASLDEESDAIIQETVRDLFKDATIISIAHRLKTIIDNDVVMVMDQGQILEFDSPHNLLQDIHSEFSKLVDETGKANASLLRSMAKEAAKVKSI